MTRTTRYKSRQPDRAWTSSDRLSLWRTLWLLSTVAVFYGALIPFEFPGDVDAALRKAKAAMDFSAPWSRHGGLSTPDIVQNVLLFLPFGFFAYLCGARAIVVVAGAAVLSLSVECLQLFTRERVTSWLDLATNVTGGLTGYLLAPRLMTGGMRLHARALRAGLTDSSQSRAAVALLVLAVIHHFHPFAFKLDVSQGWQQLLALPDTLYLSPERGDGLTVLHWALASSLISAAVRERVTPLRCALLLVAAAITAELVQFIIRARAPGLHDLIVAMASIGLGVFASWWRPTHGAISSSGSRGKTDTLLPLLALLLFLGTAAWDTLYPFELERFGGITWLPFEQSYNKTTFTTLSNALELLLSGLAVGLVFGCYAPTRASRVLGAAMATAGFALLELSQAWVVGRYAGSEDIIAVAMGLWLGIRLSPGLLLLRSPGRRGQRDPS